MRLVRPVALLTAALGILVLASPAAHAQTRAVQRGVTGCFAWSWDPGFAWTTVYWHNRCDTAHVLRISWKYSGIEESTITVLADAKGNQSRMSDPESIWDGGRP